MCVRSVLCDKTREKRPTPLFYIILEDQMFIIQPNESATEFVIFPKRKYSFILTELLKKRMR
jgi:hypothetical protein